MLSISLAIYYTWKIFLSRVNLSSLLIIVTILLSLTTTSFMQINETNSNEEIDITTRLELKTESSSQDAIELEGTETEIGNGTAHAQNLKTETKLDESIELSEAEINILRSLLSEELEANNRKNILPTIINNLCFCLLGMIGPPLLKSWRLAYERVVKFLETIF